MKKCPFCAEKIQDDAILCRYCGKELPKVERPPKAESHKPDIGKFLLPLGILLGVLILAVGGYFLLSNKPASSNHPTLYALDFENKAAFFGWHVGGPGTDLFWLENTRDGKYYFEFPSGFLETEDVQFSDIQISADVEFLVDTRMDVSVACRLHQGEGYGFSIGNDGTWAITKSYQSQWMELAQGWSAEIKPDKNKLSGRCVGSQLTLLVNDVEVGHAEDSDMTIGGINLGYNADEAGAGTFDNIVVEDWGDGQSTVPQTTIQSDSAPTEVAALDSSTPTPATVATATFAPTPIPTLRPTQIPQDELVLYQTGFDKDDPSLSKWRSFAYSFLTHSINPADSQIDARSGYYHIGAPEINQRVFSIYDEDLGTADVDITLEGTGQIGIVCRYSEAGWYQFVIEPRETGIWSIRLAKYDEAGQLHFYQLSSGLTWGIKTVRAECKGDRLSFYVNGMQQASLHDSTFPTGKVGVLGWSFDTPGEIGLLDSFIVQRAQWSESTVSGPAPTPGTDGVIYDLNFDHLDELYQYWYAEPVPWEEAPRYIHDFDPGMDVEITARLKDNNMGRSLICRYSEDGWYDAGFWKDPVMGPVVVLSRMERGPDGIVRMGEWLGSKKLSSIPDEMTLTCAGQVISISINGDMAIVAEDNVFGSGRYGFSAQDDEGMAGNLRYAFSSYIVRPAQTLNYQPGDTISTTVYDTPEKILSEGLVLWDGLNPNDFTAEIQNYAIALQAQNSGILMKSAAFENVEATFELEFLTESGFHMGCRNDGSAVTTFSFGSDGAWFIESQGQGLAGGQSDIIKPGANQFTIRCVDNQATFTANGEILASVEIPSYGPASGNVALYIGENSQVELSKFTLTVIKGNPLPTVTMAPNQVSISTYQPGEEIYAWNSRDFMDRSLDWSRFSKGIYPLHEENGAVIVSGQSNEWTAWIHRKAMNDLPVEIKAETIFTGESGALGLMCRYTQVGRYEFLIQPDGNWIIRRNTSEYYAPSEKNMTILAKGQSTAIQPESNQLTAICQGNELIFYANGEELGRVEDDYYPEGSVGIFFDPYTAASFTNLSVRRAE